VQVLPDDGVCPVVGVSQVTGHLRAVPRLGHKGEIGCVGIPRLRGHGGEIDRIGIDPGGRARLEAADCDAQIQKALRQFVGGGKARRALRPEAVAHKNPTAQIDPGGEDDRLGAYARAVGKLYARAASALRQDARDFTLRQGQPLLAFNGLPHPEGIGLLIRLCPEAADGGAFGSVQQAHLQTGVVRGKAHFAAQGVHLPHQVAFGCAADGGIAGHEGQMVQVQGHKTARQPHARRGQGRFASRMARAYSQHIKKSIEFKHLFS